MVISASYTDKGGNNIKALTGKTTISLQRQQRIFYRVGENERVCTFKYNGQQVMIFPAKNGWVASDSVDLTGVTG